MISNLENNILIRNIRKISGAKYIILFESNDRKSIKFAIFQRFCILAKSKNRLFFNK